MTYDEALRRVEKGEMFEDYKTLKITDEYGYTVAHDQACKGWTTEDPEILKLANKKGYTVAHWQAIIGWKPKTKEAKAYILAERLKE